MPDDLRSRTSAPPLAARRLRAQQLVAPSVSTPAELVRWMGAVQAQDYAAAKWAVGLRLPESAGATEAAIEAAVSEGTILRTHVFRGTWQLVTPQDLRWMVALVAPRILAAASRRHRELALDAATLRRSLRALEKALGEGQHLTRGELAAVLERSGISTDGQRLSHILQQAELEALICSGASRGKHATWALLDLRVPRAPVPDREESVAELVLRYFRSRGPATVDDFVWWSGLTVADARAGLAEVKGALVSEVHDGRTYWRGELEITERPKPVVELLPAFDEYLVAYRDRGASLAPEHLARINAGGGMLRPCVSVGGRIVATWRRTLQKKRALIEVEHLLPPTAALKRGLAAAAQRYGAFLGVEVRL